MIAILQNVAKALVAFAVPWLLPLAHQIGLTEITSSGLSTALTSVMALVFVYAMPNKAKAVTE
jgi:molybdopterin biosynthesis enzyme MoaB